MFMGLRVPLPAGLKSTMAMCLPLDASSTGHWEEGRTRGVPILGTSDRPSLDNSPMQPMSDVLYTLYHLKMMCRQILSGTLERRAAQRVRSSVSARQPETFWTCPSSGFECSHSRTFFRSRPAYTLPPGLPTNPFHLFTPHAFPVLWLPSDFFPHFLV